MIDIKDLRKSFGSHLVLDGLSLKIPDGAVFGMVGPNGAGKTTTFKIMAGLLSADSGSVFVDNEDIRIGTSRDMIGYMPDFFGVYDRLKVSEYMELFASIYRLRGSEEQDRIDELLDLVGLSGMKNVYVDSLSRGMKQKLCLARCMINKPRILILDEPASGMDPRSRIEFRDIVRKMHDQDVTILISSHILSELSQMCTDICIIKDGKAVVSGSVAEIEYRITASVKLLIIVNSDRDKAISILRSDTLADRISYSGNTIYVTYSGSHEDEAELLARLVSAGVPVYRFTHDRGELENLFLEITEDPVNYTSGSDRHVF